MSDRALGIVALIVALAIIVATLAGLWTRWDAVAAHLMQGEVV